MWRQIYGKNGGKPTLKPPSFVHHHFIQIINSLSPLLARFDSLTCRHPCRRRLPPPLPLLLRLHLLAAAVVVLLAAAAAAAIVTVIIRTIRLRQPLPKILPKSVMSYSLPSQQDLSPPPSNVHFYHPIQKMSLLSNRIGLKFVVTPIMVTPLATMTTTTTTWKKINSHSCSHCQSTDALWPLHQFVSHLLIGIVCYSLPKREVMH